MPYYSSGPVLPGWFFFWLFGYVCNFILWYNFKNQFNKSYEKMLFGLYWNSHHIYRLLYVTILWYSFFKIQGYDLSLHFLSSSYNYFHNGYTHVLLNFPLGTLWDVCALTQMGSLFFHYFFLFVKDFKLLYGLFISATLYSTCFLFCLWKKVDLFGCNSEYNKIFKVHLEVYLTLFLICHIDMQWHFNDLFQECWGTVVIYFNSLALRLFSFSLMMLLIKLPKCSLDFDQSLKIIFQNTHLKKIIDFLQFIIKDRK